MVNYAFIDSNNKVINITVFEEEPDQATLTTFIELEGTVHNTTVVDAIKITDVHAKCKIGDTWTTEVFMPEQPYPSWVWNEVDWAWIPPVLHPHAVTGFDFIEYEWDEATTSWTAK